MNEFLCVCCRDLCAVGSVPQALDGISSYGHVLCICSLFLFTPQNVRDLLLYRNYRNVLLIYLIILFEVLHCTFLKKNQLSCRFKKPNKEKMLTPKYYAKFAADQELDNISVHRGVESMPSSREGSKQGSIISRLSGRKKPTTPDHTSLLEMGENSDSDSSDQLG